MPQRGFAPIYIIFGLILVIGIITGIFFLTRSNNSSQPVVTDGQKEPMAETSKEVDKFIVVSPVDLAQIKNISKFRSCSGHDFSGQNVEGVREKNRSMKHYFEPAVPFVNSIGEVKVFAPFDGKIKSVRDERVPRGKETVLVSEGSSWDVTIFHLDLLPTLKEGSAISARQLIGHAHLGSQGHDFDIAVSKFVGGLPDFKNLSSDQTEKMQDFFFSMMMMDSVFNHMTPEVLADFEKVGITSTNIITGQKERDQAPCDFTKREDSAADWIELQNVKP